MGDAGLSKSFPSFPLAGVHPPLSIPQVFLPVVVGVSEGASQHWPFLPLYHKESARQHMRLFRYERGGDSEGKRR